MRHGLYALLGIPRAADDALIRSAYRRRALATHPDKGGSAAEFLEVVEAFEVLSDRGRRLAYDEELARSSSSDGLFKGAVPANFETSAPDPAEPRKTAEGALAAQEGTGLAEERRAAKLWHELLELASEARPPRIAALSFRAAERLLAFAESQACAGGAPFVAGASSLEGAALALLDGESCPEEGGLMEDRAGSCGTGLLAVCAEVREEADGGEAPDQKRARVEAPPPSSQHYSHLRGGSRAWVCLDSLKICTGSSQDVAEAINWHIMIVRIKQLFHEARAGGGRGFDDALRAAVQSVLAERATEGSSDPRLRFVNEYTCGGGVLFTPATRHLDTALRQRAELDKLRKRSAAREEVLAAIRRMTTASAAAEEEQARLLDLLRQQAKAFAKALRWQGARPDGVNAVFVDDRPAPARGTPAEGAGGGSQRPSAAPGGSRRVAVAYAEVWRPSAEGLTLLCRGPRRPRVDAALADGAAIRGARASGGDAAAKLEARRLYEQEMRSHP